MPPAPAPAPISPDQWQQFASNITNANGGAGSDIYKNYAIGKVGLDESAQAVAPKLAGAQANIDQINQQNAAAAAAVEAQKAQDAQDPNKAQMKLLPNNQGFAFYDGTGKQININQYSLLTGKTPDQILANSPSPKDQQFSQDYKMLSTLSNAWVNGDTKTLDAIRSADPKKFNEMISTYKSPSDMVAAFTKHWSSYYGGAAQTNPSNFSPGEAVSPGAAKAARAPVGSSSLAQVLTPQTIQKPSYSIGGSILSHIPGTAEHAAVSNYHAEMAANPWFAYNNNLYGN